MNILRKMNIKGQLLTLAVSTIALMCVTLAIVYFLVGRILIDNNRSYTESIVSQIERNVASGTELFNHMLVGIAFNRSVQKYLLETSELKRYESFKEVDSFLLNMKSMNDGIIDIVILGVDDRSFSLGGRNAAVEQLIRSLPVPVIEYYTELAFIPINLQNCACLLAVSTIYSMNQDNSLGDRIGEVAIVLDARTFAIDIDESDAATRFYLIDRNGRVVISNDPEAVNRQLTATDGRYFGLGGVDAIQTVNSIPTISGQLITVVNKERLFSTLSRAQWIVLSVFVGSLLLLTIPFSYIINNILRPIRKFLSFMTLMKSRQAARDELLKMRIRVDGYAEIDVMAHEFNAMLDEIEKLTQRVSESGKRLYEYELQTKQSEIAYLRSQINPHFLYNTLESINGIAVEENVPRIMEMAQALGKVFRYSIKGSDLVRLAEEWGIVKSYVRIQTVRFAGRFEVGYDFPEAILDAIVPKMILQPLVENAIFHGLETMRGKGRLDIGGRLTAENDLVLWVKDNGVGMSRDKLDAIRASLASRGVIPNADRPEASIGVVNVFHRIRLIYGEPYGLNIDSAEGMGTEINLRIPARRDDRV